MTRTVCAACGCETFRVVHVPDHCLFCGMPAYLWVGHSPRLAFCGIGCWEIYKEKLWQDDARAALRQSGFEI